MFARQGLTAGRRVARTGLAGCLVATAVLFLGACTPARSTAPGAQDQIDVYELAIRRICGPEGPGSNLAKPVVYLVGTTDSRAQAPSAASSDPQTLSSTVRGGLSKRLADLPGTVRWVESFNAVELEPHKGPPKGGGVIVTVGDIVSRSDGSVEVGASIYGSGTAAGGLTYVLKRTEGGWTIVGTTGGGWVS